MAAALLLAAPEAFAQAEPSATEMAAARRLFQSGVAHARAERWPEALADFERSHAIAAVPVTLYNLAGAQAAVGRLVAAAESYRRFLARGTSGRALQYRAEAEAALQDVDRRIARLTIEADGARADDRLSIDDDAIAMESLGVALPVDPGAHTLRLVRDDELVASSDVTLEEGEQRTVTLEVRLADTAPVELAPIPTDPVDDHEGSSVLASPWLWTGVGAAVAAGVVVAIVLTRGGSEDPFVGTAGPGRLEF